ncbi:hypothetical protein LTR27_012993 [Elasticomyces elasticus]|nr:hypothetical protein LTR27_012993 [Elasticomyces elasticus]
MKGSPVFSDNQLTILNDGIEPWGKPREFEVPNIRDYPPCYPKNGSRSASNISYDVYTRVRFEKKGLNETITLDLIKPSYNPYWKKSGIWEDPKEQHLIRLGSQSLQTELNPVHISRPIIAGQTDEDNEVSEPEEDDSVGAAQLKAVRGQAKAIRGKKRAGPSCRSQPNGLSKRRRKSKD